MPRGGSLQLYRLVRKAPQLHSRRQITQESSSRILPSYFSPLLPRSLPLFLHHYSDVTRTTYDSSWGSSYVQKEHLTVDSLVKGDGAYSFGIMNWEFPEEPQNSYLVFGASMKFIVTMSYDESVVEECTFYVSTAYGDGSSWYSMMGYSVVGGASLVAALLLLRRSRNKNRRLAAVDDGSEVTSGHKGEPDQQVGADFVELSNVFTARV